MSGLESFLQSYGLAAIVLGTFFEGETILVLAGLAAHRGYLPLPAVVAAGFIGTFLGDLLYYHVGRIWGPAILARRPSWRPRIERAQQVLVKHDVAFILGFRFLYGLRTVSPFAIGLSHVSAVRYLVLSGLGGVIWSVAVAVAGYSVGEGAEALIGRVKEFELWLFGGIGVIGLGVWVAYGVRRHVARKCGKLGH